MSSGLSTFPQSPSKFRLIMMHEIPSIKKATVYNLFRAHDRRTNISTGRKKIITQKKESSLTIVTAGALTIFSDSIKTITKILNLQTITERKKYRFFIRFSKRRIIPLFIHENSVQFSREFLIRPVVNFDWEQKQLFSLKISNFRSRYKMRTARRFATVLQTHISRAQVDS